MACAKGICLCLLTKLCNNVQGLPKYAGFIKSLPPGPAGEPKVPLDPQMDFICLGRVRIPSTLLFPLSFELLHCRW